MLGKEKIMGKRSNGEGTIFKRKDGRWCAAYYDKEYNRRYVYGQTQKEVKQKLKEKKSAKKLKKNKSVTLQGWVLEYLEKYKKNELKITTYDSYLCIYRKHILESKIGKMQLENVSLEILQNYYNRKIKEGYSSKTVREIGTIINSALNMAVRTRLLTENPNLYTTIPKKEKYEAKILSKEEVEKILREAKDEELYPIIITTVYTGMRKGEVMALKWENVDFKERKIHIRGSLCRIQEEPDKNGRRHARYEILEPKTKKSIRTVPMLDEVYNALLEQKKRQNRQKNKYSDVYLDNDLIFANEIGDFIEQRTFMENYHNFLEKYDITDIRFHDLRHTFASLLIESDVSMKVVQELLGHSTITTSMDIYTHISDKKKEQAIQVLGKGKDK